MNSSINTCHVERDGNSDSVDLEPERVFMLYTMRISSYECAQELNWKVREK